MKKIKAMMLIMILSISMGSCEFREPKKPLVSQETVERAEEEREEKEDGSDAAFVPFSEDILQAQDPVEVNGNKPFFDGSEMAQIAKEEGYYILSELDNLGRCGPCMGIFGPETLAQKERGSIGMIKPSGWHNVKYDGIDGGFLQNRCHLLAYKLSGILDDPRDLITGTRNMNLTMFIYESILLDYIYEHDNHVLYRVTPYFYGDDLMSRGVLMEAVSIEDDTICFCVYIPNVQPGIWIDYRTGESSGPAYTGT